MRRLTAILLLLQFLLVAGTPLLAAGAESSLPACCRRDGKHHCMGHMPEGLQIGTSLRASNSKCPAFPKIATASNSCYGDPGGSQEFYALLITRPATYVRVESSYRICWRRSRQKRGPPALFS
jgi:hypothetical protein